MDAFTATLWIMGAGIVGAVIGYLAAIDAAKAGKLERDGITYSYLKTDKHLNRSRIHRAMYQAR